MFFIHQQAGRTARIIGTSANIPFLWTIYKKAHPEIKRLTPHELRHTRATLSANDDDVDLFQLAKLLGHSDLNMLIKRYAHTDVEAMRKALKIGDKDG